MSFPIFPSLFQVDDSQCSSCVSGQVCECDCGGDGGPSSGRPTKFLIALGRDSLFDIETEFLPSASDAGETGVECSKPEDFPRFMETAVAALIGGWVRCSRNERQQQQQQI